MPSYLIFKSRDYVYLCSYAVLELTCTCELYWITKFQLKLNFCCWYWYFWTYSVCLSSKITLLIMVISLQYQSRKLKQYSNASFLHIKRILTSEFISRLQRTVILWYGERSKIPKIIILYIKNDKSKKFFFSKKSWVDPTKMK